jgi:Putative prokaryotic signal transducing protein
MSKSAEEEWKVVDEVPGVVQAEILQGLLEAQGIKVFLSEEGAGRAFGLSAAPMGTVQVLVLHTDYDAARAVLDEYYEGDFENYEGGDDVSEEEPS